MQENLQEIFRRIKKGDQEAFRRVVEHYQQPAFTLAFRILGDEEEAKDAIQEGFIKIWQHLERYNPTQKFSSWMFRIMANCAIDRIRKIRRRNEVTLEQVPEIMEKACSQDSEITLDNREMAQLIRILAGELPEKQQLVFILRDIEGMESAESEEIPQKVMQSIQNPQHRKYSFRLIGSSYIPYLTYAQRMLTAASVCLLILYGVEEFIVVKKMNTLEQHTASVSVEPSNTMASRLIQRGITLPSLQQRFQVRKKLLAEQQLASRNQIEETIKSLQP
ncbi:MAG: sigma-70 family RNA polymerase sigma factor [Bacteroidia bacterium]|nr:sigma-70 family RNA polymerase sigma factor [Bacteroidia bacterium]